MTRYTLAISGRLVYGEKTQGLNTRNIHIKTNLGEGCVPVCWQLCLLIKSGFPICRLVCFFVSPKFGVIVKRLLRRKRVRMKPDIADEGKIEIQSSQTTVVAESKIQIKNWNCPHYSLKSMLSANPYPCSLQKFPQPKTNSNLDWKINVPVL